MSEPYMWIKENNRLVPADPWTAERFDGFKEGALLKAATLTVPRSLPKNNFYWVVLSEICKATEIAPNAKYLHGALLKLCGYVTPVYNKSGKVIELVVDSTSFDRMEQPEFDKYFEHAQRTLAEDFGICWDDYTLKQKG